MSTVLGTQKKNSYLQLMLRNQKLVYIDQSPIQGHAANSSPVLGIKYCVSNPSVSFIKKHVQISLPSYKYSRLEIVLCERTDLSNQIFLHCLTAWSFQLPKGGLHLYYCIILFQDDHFEMQLKTKKKKKRTERNSIVPWDYKGTEELLLSDDVMVAFECLHIAHYLCLCKDADVDV